jgi:hypothetical protein
LKVVKTKEREGKMKKIVLCIAMSMLLFTSMFAGLPKVSSSSELIVKTGSSMRRSTSTASNTSQILQNYTTHDEAQPSPSGYANKNNRVSEVFTIIVEKSHANTTFIVTFALSALTTNSTLSLPSEVIKAIKSSSRVIVEDSSGDYGNICYYETWATNYLGARTHYYFSPSVAADTDTALAVLAIWVDFLAGVIMATTGGLAAPISALTGLIVSVTAYNYNKIYSTDHNPNGSLDLWTDIIVWEALWNGDFVWTLYHVWFCSLFGAYQVSDGYPTGTIGVAGFGWRLLRN